MSSDREQSFGIRVFGHVAPVGGEQGGPVELSRVQTQLLAALVAVGPDGQPHDRLAEILWPAGPPRSWYAALRLNVSRLRDQFLDLDIRASSGRYRLACAIGDVDAWWLDALVRSETDPNELDVRRAIIGRPYDGVHSGPLLDDARHLAEFQQRRLVERFRGVGATSIEDDTASSLIAHAAREYTDTETIGQVVTILDVADRADEAARLLQTVIDRHRSEIGIVPDELTSRLRALVPNRIRPRPERADLPPADRHPALDCSRTGRLIGQRGIVDTLTSADSCLLLGPSGSGRTRLTAAAVERLTAVGQRCVYVTPLSDDSLPLAPLHVAVPSLATLRVPSHDDSDRMTESVRQHWQHLLRLADEADDHVHVFVDDAEQIDASSLDVVRLLLHSSLTHPRLSVTVAADIDDCSPAWLTLRHHLEHLKVRVCSIPPLGIDDILAAVQNHFPNATIDSASGLADDILEASAGLAALVVTLLGAADPSSLRLPERAVAGDETSRLLRRLSDEVRTVGVGAAVLGDTFRLTDLIRLLDHPAAVVEGSIADLWNRELVDECDDPDLLRFRDLRLRHALLGSVPRFQLTALHLRALEIEVDPHRRAHHAFAATPRCDPDAAAALLTESACGYLEHGQWRAVARECERIETLLGDRTSIEVLTMWATALDSSGLDGSEPRRRSFDQAAALFDWSLAAAAALSGLPQCERTAGDPARLDLLRRLPFDQVPAIDRFEVAHYLSRLSAHGGLPDEARHWAGTTLDLAETETELALAHISMWTVRHHLDPADHTFPPALWELGGGEGGRMQQMMAIAAFEANDRTSALAHHRRFVELAGDDPIRTWHALCFDALLALDAGDVAAAWQIAAEAYEHGTLHGAVEAASARAACLFFDAWTRTDLSELAPFMWQLRNNLGRSIVGRAGMAITDAMHGDRKQGRRDAVAIMTDALVRPGSMSLPIVASLAEVVSTTDQQSMIAEARQFLLPFGSTSVVVGFGLFNLGPTWRYLAHLAADDDERVEWLHLAVRDADRSGSLRWRILNRLALANHLGAADVVHEASRLAVGTELQSLFVDDILA